jgi:preprotein translocase subunit SecE
VAESKRRGEKAVDERLDDDEVFDAVDDDASDEDEFDDDLTDDDDGTDVATTRGSRAATKAAATAKGTKSVKAAKVDTTSGGGGRIARFIREIVAELRKVNWPSRKELLTYTLVVLVFVTVISSLVFGLDYGFAWLVSHSFAGK